MNLLLLHGLVNGIRRRNACYHLSFPSLFSTIPSKHLKLEIPKLHFIKVSVKPGMTVSSAIYTVRKLSYLHSLIVLEIQENLIHLRLNITSFSDKKSKT